MADVKDFTLWLLQNIPDFLMSDPVKYVWGFILSAYILRMILSLKRRR